MASTNSRRKLYLGEYGHDICDNGYLVLPCRAEQKRPAMKEWSSVRADSQQIDTWLGDNYYKRDGVSLLTGVGDNKVVAVDVDVRDEDMANRIIDYVQETYGFAPLRMGNKPKVLFLFRTKEQFGKLRTATYIDPLEDEEHAVEILASGQQLVAYSIHPNTGKPYVWHKDFGSPKDTKASDLPELTHAECKDIVIYCTDLFEDEGWEVKKKSKPMGLDRKALTDHSVEDIEGDLSDVERKDPIAGVDVDEAREILSYLTDQADAGYDAWLAVGSALHHQFQGDGEGLELWDEWSQNSSDYDRDELEAKWDSFDWKHSGARIVTGCTERQIDITQLWICAHQGPNVCSSGYSPTIVFPSFVAQFSFLGDRMKNPAHVARINIKTSYVARRQITLLCWNLKSKHRRILHNTANYNCVIDNCRCGSN